MTLAVDWSVKPQHKKIHEVGHSPVFQILLQIEVSVYIIVSPSAWINSAGMLSTPADFPIFSALTAASTSSRRIG